MTNKTIIVPNRDGQGWLHGVRTINVDWKCHICGEEMGNPKLQQFCEEGEWYSVHMWVNPCGHIAKYKDLRNSTIMGN